MRTTAWIALAVLGACAPTMALAAREPAPVTAPADPAAALRSFNQRWAQPDYGPAPVAASALDRAEAALGHPWPAAYRDAVLGFGLPFPTFDLWAAIELADADLPHLSEFLAPEDAVAAAEGWRPAGFPDDLLPFASDSGGNILAFRAGEGDAVWLWDHDDTSVRQIALSLVDLLRTYTDLPRAED